VSPKDLATQELQRLSADLLNPLMLAARREEAARRLLARPGPQSTQALINALQANNDAGAQLAVARALASAPTTPDAAFIPPLVAALGPNRALTDAAAQALASYDQPNALAALRTAADNNALPEPSRAAIVRAMGQRADKPTAEYLVSLVTTRTGQIQSAAADALGEMTGRENVGPDRAYWQRWWTDNANKPDVQWRADLLTARGPAYNHARQRLNQLSDDIRVLLTDQFNLIPAPQRGQVMLGYLESRDPVIRAAGPAIAREYFGSWPLPDNVRERLRDMVGDSDENVRRSVVAALFVMNDRAAAPALITQLAQEPVPDIRQQIARALGRTNDLQGVPLLLEMVQRNDPDDALAAAQALADPSLGATLRTGDPALAHHAAEVLKGVIDTLRNNPNPAVIQVRATCVSALAELRDARTMNTFLQLLKAGEDPTVRRAALRGLGTLGDPNAAEAIADWLADQDRDTRLDAATALLNTATFAQAERLYRQLDPQQEPDQRVQAAVWQALQRLLHTGTTQQLIGWPDRFKNDPPKRLEALYALRDALIRDHNLEQLAFQQQNIAETVMKVDPPRPDEAAANIQKALDYWRGEGRNKDGSEATLDGLVGQMLSVQFAARQYTDAVTFAAKQIEINPQYQVTVGSRIKQEADQLVAAGRNADAIQLIDAALKMSPALDSKYQRDLNDIRAEAAKNAPAAPQ
jgi:HEAT repeat protein